MKHRTWYIAALVAAALHGGAWLALNVRWSPFAPERMKFSMVEAELAQAPAPAVQRAAPDPSPKKEETPQREKPKDPPTRQERVASPVPPAPEGNSKPASSPSAPAAPVEAKSGPAGEVSSEPVYAAAYLNNPPPPYPMVARRRGISGVVLLRAEVSAEGRCLQARVTKSSGFGPLDEAALEAVKKWRFAPAKRGGQSVSAWVEIPVNFKLEGEG